nr:mitochondrial import receptor subunit TOM6 homolog [Ipomoea batatas]
MFPGMFMRKPNKAASLKQLKAHVGMFGAWVVAIRILGHTENLRGCDLRVESPLAISTAQLTTSPSLLATGIPFTIDRSLSPLTLCTLAGGPSETPSAICCFPFQLFQFSHRLSTLSTFAWGYNKRD